MQFYRCCCVNVANVTIGEPVPQTDGVPRWWGAVWCLTSFSAEWNSGAHDVFPLNGIAEHSMVHHLFFPLNGIAGHFVVYHQPFLLEDD